jgi:DNA repair protein SbcD/Mre11
MFEPLRFLHVADVGLDQPLGDVGLLPDPFRQLAEDATLIAFDQMVACAISRNVDCVLLAGNTFHEADQSPRARLNLVHGLGQLKDHDISVFVLPGPHDPEWAWRSIPNLPGNVTLLTSGDAEEGEPEIPVAILREGRVIATVTAGTLAQLSAEHETAIKSNGSVRSQPFRVGMLAAWPSEPISHSAEAVDLAGHLSPRGCDYLAVPISEPSQNRLGWSFEAGQTNNAKAGIAHYPGRLQALSERETGPHGGTLIEVDAGGEIRGTFLPLACVRRLRFETPIPPDATLEHIVETMCLQLEAETPQAGEQAWFITWMLSCCESLCGLSHDPQFQTQLIDSLPGCLGENDSIRIHHQVRFQESPALMEDRNPFADLLRLYREALGDSPADDPETFQWLRDAVMSDVRNLVDADWQARLMPLVARLDADDVLAKARGLGSDWFSKGADD